MTSSNNNKQWIKVLQGADPLSVAIDAAKISEGKSVGTSGELASGGTEKGGATPVGAGSLPNLHVGRGIRYGNLTWFPIFTDAPVSSRKYLTTAAVGANGVSPAAPISVVENSSPSVGHLQVKNDAAQPVLLFEGALLEGGWQHRALTHTVWVDARTTLEIPVVCVEAGRWNGVSLQRFGTKSAPARVRRAMRGIKLNDQGAAVQSAADQSDVWTEVRNFAAATSKQHATQSLVEMAKELERETALMNLEKPRALFGQRGVLVAVSGKPLALEVFDHPDTLAERLNAILDAYLPESFAKPFAECQSQLARDFVARVEKLGVEPTENAGRLRNRADKYVASEAVVSSTGEFLHLATLNPAHELVLAA